MNRLNLDYEKVGIKDTNINEIKNEYIKIDKNWLSLHYKVSIGLVLFAFIVECFMGAFLMQTDMVLTTKSRFIWKFIIAPISVNCLCILINSVVMRGRIFTQNMRIYTISIMFPIICFVIYTVHSAFIAAFAIFLIGILLTMIYASYKVTAVTSVVSIVLFVISELFITWDFDKPSVFESTIRLVDFLVGFFTLLTFSFACLIGVHYERKKNAASIQIELEKYQLWQKLQVDEMTGVYNRNALSKFLKTVEEKKEQKAYILGIVDIDNFKGINDSWGHPVGDICIINFAGVLRENSEKYIPFRYGGDEFCLLFQDIAMEEAVEVCKSIQDKLKQLEFKECPDLILTASFGLSAYSEQLENGILLTNSDRALYEAKAIRDTIKIY